MYVRNLSLNQAPPSSPRYLPATKITASVQLNSWEMLFTANETVSYEGKDDVSVRCPIGN